jgi:hypothetical protein
MNDISVKQAHIYCPKSEYYIKQAIDTENSVEDRFNNLQKAFDIVFNEYIEHDKALQSVTPGGSEYVNNRERCVWFVKDLRGRHFNIIRTLMKERFTLTKNAKDSNLKKLD